MRRRACGYKSSPLGNSARKYGSRTNGEAHPALPASEIPDKESTSWRPSRGQVLRGLRASHLCEEFSGVSQPFSIASGLSMLNYLAQHLAY